MKLKLFLYTSYVVFVFLSLSLIFIPTLMLLGLNEKWHTTALKLHKVWAQAFFKLVMKVEVVGSEKIDSSQQYIFCSNHFSFLDIPAFCLVHYAKFIGKSSLTKIPLFGYFFKKIHIPVTRESAKSRANSLQQTKAAVDKGYNVIFFPEGGIWSAGDDLPYMKPFKDGAFRVAVEKQVPIVPITMPYNFLILPDEAPLRMHPHKCKMVIHDPIYPQDDNEAQVPALKEKVFHTIQDELLKHHPDKIKSVG